jgi:hypothetical protein
LQNIFISFDFFKFFLITLITICAGTNTEMAFDC